MFKQKIFASTTANKVHGRQRYLENIVTACKTSNKSMKLRLTTHFLTIMGKGFIEISVKCQIYATFCI